MIKGASLSFADGHVERWRWRWPKIYTVYYAPAANAQDLLDLQQLQSVLPGTDQAVCASRPGIYFSRARNQGVTDRPDQLAGSKFCRKISRRRVS